MTLAELTSVLALVAELPAEARAGAIGALAAAQARLLALVVTPPAAPVGLVSAEVLAAELDVPPTWLRAQARAGKLPHVRAGKYVKFDRAAVLAALSVDHRMGHPATAEKPSNGAAPLPRRFQDSGGA